MDDGMRDRSGALSDGAATAGAGEPMAGEIMPRPGELVYRHKVVTRIWHWSNVVAIFIMLGSGLMIFNAHPRLYWGEYGANTDTPWLMIGATSTTGFVQLGQTRVPTTGVLGRWADAEGIQRTRAFPYWATLPASYNLALARRWHLTFAWLLAFGLLFFMIASLFNRHFQRDLVLHREEVKPSHIWWDTKEHLQFRFHNPEKPLAYNVLQKFSYIGVLFIMIPGIILTGLTMSPAMNAAWPWLLDLFGGRQSARSIHFIFAALLFGFIIMHVILVILAGPFNEMRSMITGRFRIPKETSR